MMGKFSWQDVRPTSVSLWEFPGARWNPVKIGRLRGQEIMEELAIECVAGIYDVVFHRYPERDVLVLAYRCRWLSGEVRDLEVSEHCWASPADIANFELLPADIPLAHRIGLEFGNGDTARL
jgi:8-oxo-dGTP diphosphatase